MVIVCFVNVIYVVGLGPLFLHMHIFLDTDICRWHVATYEEEVMVHVRICCCCFLSFL